MSFSNGEIVIMSDLQGFMTPKQVRRVINNAGSTRNKLFIKVLAYAGRRISEVVGLRIKDDEGKTHILGGLKPKYIDVDNNLILWTTLKKKQRSDNYKISMSWKPCQTSLINQLINYSKAVGITEEDLIFPFTRQWGYKIVNKAGRAAGINKVGEKPIHPHHFRHSFIINSLKAGVPIHEVQRLVDHSSLKITEFYIKLSPDDLRQGVNKLALIYDDALKRDVSTEKVGGNGS